MVRAQVPIRDLQRVLERLQRVLQGLAGLARLLSHLSGLHPRLQLAHAEVKVGDEENEQVFNEGGVGLELDLRDFVHLLHEFSFDAVESALCRTRSLLVVLLSELDHAQVVEVDRLVDGIAELFLWCQGYSLAIVVDSVRLKRRLTCLTLLVGLLPELNGMFVVQSGVIHLVLAFIVATDVGQQAALQLQWHILAEE